MATYAQQQAENLLKYYQGMGGTMRKPSALASAEEREAFAAQEARAGRAPMETLPEEYGGRPTGTTRRAIRMQEAWDAQQAAILAREQEAREIEEFNKNMLVRDLDYQTKSLDLELKRTELAADLQNQKIIKEQAVTAREIFGKYPDTPEGLAAASAEINKVAPRAWEDETIGKIYFYKNKNSEAVAGAIEAQNAEKLTGKEREEVAMVSEQTGLPMSNFITTDPKTGLDVVDYEALGRAKGTLRAREEEEPTYGGKTERSIESIVTAISADIVEAEAAGDLVKVEALEAKKAYYENLVPKDNVENAAKPSNIPAPDKRKKGEVYDTPRGKLKWTGTGWVTP